MSKSLDFIRKHVKTWPEGAETVRLDRDGEICFVGVCGRGYDFYPDGYDESMFEPMYEYKVIGIKHTFEEWRDVTYPQP